MQKRGYIHQVEYFQAVECTIYWNAFKYFTKKQPPGVFLKFSHNSQENNCVKVSFLINLQALGLRPATVLKNTPTQVFSRGFCEFFTNTIEHSRWLLLILESNKFNWNMGPKGSINFLYFVK